MSWRSAARPTGGPVTPGAAYRRQQGIVGQSGGSRYAHRLRFCIPPFSFHPDLRLIADPLLFDRYPEIAFNAGQLDKSIILNTEDYLRIARPELVAFRRES